jgi:hypothetical protein
VSVRPWHLNHEDIFMGLGLERVLVSRHEVEFVAESRTFNHRVSHVGRDGHKQVVWNFLVIPGHDPVSVAVDVGDVEIVNHRDAFFLKQVA